MVTIENGSLRLIGNNFYLIIRTTKILTAAIKNISSLPNFGCDFKKPKSAISRFM